MILLPALLVTAVLTERPAAEFVAAVQACVSAQASGRMEEGPLIRAGWKRRTTDADEATAKVRSFTQVHGPPIYTELKPEGHDGCVVSADTPVSGGQAALFAALDAALGIPATTTTLPSGVMRVWHISHDHILFLGRAETGFKLVITHTYAGTN